MERRLQGILTLFLVLVVQITFAQEKTIGGQVVDEQGFPLVGVNVIEKGTSNGAQTDIDGNYTIRVETGDVLVFSYVGFLSQEVLVGNSDVYNVTLAVDQGVLEEVVVIAFGQTTKEAFTGSADVVTAEDMETRSLTSPIAAIEGNATGVQFLSSSGQPGSSPEIVIRGVGTLNGSTDPLYVVDGIQYEGGISSLNQNDIKSITVLKDAASTSLYGSRAANGVVLITTKSGVRNADLTVTVNSQVGVIQKAIDEYEAVSPGQYYELMWEAYKNSIGGPDAAAEASSTIYNRLGYNPFDVPNDQIVGVDGQLNPEANLIFEGLDWYDALERTGNIQNHNLSVSGGGDEHSFFFSASNLQEEGYVVESSFDRTTSRLNGSFYPTEWLTLGGDANLSLSTSSGPASRGTSIANPFSFAKDMGSIYPVYLVDSETGEIVRDAQGNPLYDRGEGYDEYGILPRPTNVARHAIEEAILNDNNTKINTYGFRYNAGIQLMEGLELSLVYGQDINDFFNKMYENNLVGDGAPAGRYRETRYRRTVENFNQLLNYNNTFGDHNLELTLGHESFDRHYSEVFGFKNTQTAVGINEFANFSVVADLSGYSSDKTLEGYFGRLNYNFGEKYYLTGSARRDGSSVFSSDVRWGNFYSFGGAWRIDQEDFMDDVQWVNNLKLRGSYGEVGNDNLLNDNGSSDYYISQPRYALYPNAGAPGIFWSNLGNNALTWETVESWDVALEYSLFDYRLTGSIEYYKKNSTDLLYNVPLPLSMGLNEGPANIADMYNEGIEVGVNAQLIDNGDFSWNLGLQASTFRNEITKIPEPFINGSKRWAEGKSAFDFFLYDYAGVDAANGDALFYAYEEDPETGEISPVLSENGAHVMLNDFNEAGRTYVDANTIPDVIGSVRNQFRYLNFDLSFLITYQIGGEVIDYGYADMMQVNSYGESIHPDALNAWRSPGDITDVPRLEIGNNLQSPFLSTRWLTDASYVALRNVNFSYNLSESLTDKVGMDRFKLFVSAENLAIWSERTGLDPQYNLAGTPEGNDYNPNRLITFGVNLAF